MHQNVNMQVSVNLS